MREIRIYQPGEYGLNDTVELSPEAGQHVGVVLRMQPGARLTLFCGNNREFEAAISSVHKKKVSVKISGVKEISRESPRKIHLAQAISKGDRMEMVVQKAVELGVASITPLITARCVIKMDADRLEKKRAQWEAIAISACEQSGRNIIPAIHTGISMQEYLKKERPSLNFVLSPQATKNWREVEFGKAEIGLLIGPEGGLTHDEIELLAQYQFLPLQLGPRILRTETAALAGLTVLQAICGDL